MGWIRGERGQTFKFKKLLLHRVFRSVFHVIWSPSAHICSETSLDHTVSRKRTLTEGYVTVLCLVF